MVELNHRSQACEVLTGTCVRVAKDPQAHRTGHLTFSSTVRGLCRPAGFAWESGRASGYRALYSGLEDRRVSLNTYARRAKAGIPCWNRTSLCGFANHRLNYSANGMKFKMKTWEYSFQCRLFDRIIPSLREGFPAFPRNPAEAAIAYACMAAFLYWWRFQFAVGPLGIHLLSALRAAKGHYPTMRIQPTSSALAGRRKALIVQWTQGLGHFRPNSGHDFAFPIISRLLTVSRQRTYRDVRVPRFRRLLDDAMPHTSCASLAGSHRTSRLWDSVRPGPSALARRCPITSRSTIQPLRARLEPDDYPCSSTVTVCVSAVLGATVSGSLRRCPRLRLHSSFQHSSSPAINLQEWACISDHLRGADP